MTASPSPLARLRGATRRVLCAQPSDASLASEVRALRDALFDAQPAPVGRLGATDDASTAETRTAHGLALSPTMAALCLDDHARTAAFLRGVHDAIAAVRAEAGRPVRVLYAGCGPLAPLAVPLMAVLGPDAARFTLLDVHSASTASVAGVVEALGLEACLDATVPADVLAHRVDPDRPPDVIVAEVMQAGLVREPQVAVTRHLVAQAPRALLVPERIALDIVLVDATDAGRPDIDLGTAFAVDREMAATWDAAATVLPGATLRIPEVGAEDRTPQLATRIQVFGSHGLSPDASDLTITLPLTLDPRPGARIACRYELGESPGLRVSAGLRACA